MTAKNSCLFALLGCLCFLPLLGQAQADSAAFEQGRLRIWCETTRFVYEDNKADSLLPSLNCQSWQSLQAAMSRTDGSLGVLRLMNSVDKPAIYQGYTTHEAKLQKLVGEIATRLKQSPVRRSNTARLARVDSLQQQLVLLVRQTDPASEPAVTAEADDYLLDEEESNEALYPPADNAATVASGGPLPWNEILQWLLLLGLTGLVAWRMRAYEERHNRMKKEFRTLEKQVNEFMISNLQNTSPPPAKKPLAEPEVRRLIREELKQQKPARETAAATSPAVSAVPPATTAPAPSPQVPFPAAQPVPAPEPSPSAPADAAAANGSSNGNGAGNGASKGAGLFYDKMPFRGGFHQHELSRERQRDSLYTISIHNEQAGEAEYWVTEDTDIQRYAMQNGMSFFEEGCEFSQVEENPSRVVNEQKGKLRKEGSVWKITQKARVRFE